MPRSSAERVAAYRARQRESGAVDTTRRNHKAIKKAWKIRKRSKERHFCGCDGEGAGTDELGRQNFVLFRMGDRELFRDGARLHTHELLDFICEHPRDDILVGFAFGYDVTMILRDLPESQQRRLFQPKVFGEGVSPYVWYRDFDIDYLPKQYLKIRRIKITRDNTGREIRKVIPGSTRTIYETFGFYQKSFVKVINEFGIGTEADRNRVAENKARRSSFSSIGDEERAYCKLECEMLAELMEKLREYCNAAGIIPRSWNGAGKLANALHTQHETVQAKSLSSLVPKGVADFANMAYYGGRFEITRVGSIKEKVYEYDLLSAYPAAMRSLPCLEHGAWGKLSGLELAARRRRNDDLLFVASCSFKPRNGERVSQTIQLGGLPIRSKEGHLFWPLQGNGIYWSPEIRSAEQLGFDIRLKEGWCYEKRCDCHPFDWVEPLFEYRKSIGKSGPGYPIKLGINSLYGLLAQRKGNGKFVNLVWAGLITAFTRAKLNHAISLNPSRVVMVATDAIYSLDPLPNLECGDKLGQWEEATLDNLFIVQPGLYWSPDKRKKKSRGLSGKFFETLEIDGLPATEKFEKEWERFHEFENSKVDVPFPSVRVPVPGFVGLKLAIARNKPQLAGIWVQEHRDISFDYRNKRQGHTWIGSSISLNIKRGYAGLVSIPHRDFLAAGGNEPWEKARAMLEEQPDFVDFGIPFED